MTEGMPRLRPSRGPGPPPPEPTPLRRVSLDPGSGPAQVIEFLAHPHLVTGVAVSTTSQGGAAPVPSAVVPRPDETVAAYAAGRPAGLLPGQLTHTVLAVLSAVDYLAQNGWWPTGLPLERLHVTRTGIVRLSVEEGLVATSERSVTVARRAGLAGLVQALAPHVPSAEAGRWQCLLGELEPGGSFTRVFLDDRLVAAARLLSARPGPDTGGSRSSIDRLPAPEGSGLPWKKVGDGRRSFAAAMLGLVGRCRRGLGTIDDGLERVEAIVFSRAQPSSSGGASHAGPVAAAATIIAVMVAAAVILPG